MGKIKLDSRLQSVASLVRQGSVTADIGTDHGYLLCWLIENKICPCGIASDLRKGPLDNARQTVELCGLTDKVQLVLSDGLMNIKENSCDDIVIAGMGGILISEILEKAKWICNNKIRIIAQPMTHAEYLRKFLCDNGFEIEKEVASSDGKRYYCALAAKYTGEKKQYNESYYYLGELTKSTDETTEKYIDKLIYTLEKKLVAQQSAGVSDCEELKHLIQEIKQKTNR